MELIDISIFLDSGTTVYAGDPAPNFGWPGWSHDTGGPANVGFYTGGLHYGTHVDAPWHFIRNAKRIDEIPLERWIGPAQVLDLRSQPRCVTADALAAAGVQPGIKRLLFKTGNGDKDYWREPFNPDFIYVDVTGAQWCVDHQIELIGLDYLTIDPPSLPTFPAHLVLLGHETLILENIILRDVAPGTYMLNAAPIKLRQVDGAWCRAYLTPLSRGNA